MYIHTREFTPRVYPDFYNTNIKWENYPIVIFITQLVTSDDFNIHFRTFFNINQECIKSQLPFLVALVSGSIWGKEYFNTNYDIHASILSINYELLNKEKEYTKNVLGWLFYILNNSFEQSPKKPEENICSSLTIDILGAIIEDYRSIKSEYKETTKTYISKWIPIINTIRENNTSI